MKSKNTKYKLNSWIVSIVAIAAIVLVNAIFTGLEQKLPLKIDLTEAKQFEISSETKNVMKKLDKDVNVSVLGSEENISPIVKEYMDKYKAMSSKFKVEYIDVYKNQALLYTYQSKGENVSDGDLIVECGNKYKIIASSSIYSDSMSLGDDEQMYSFELETKLTNSIVTVTGMMKESAIYFLSGHGEGESSALKTNLDTMGYKNDTVNIINENIPEDAKLLITVTPSGDFTEDECDKIDKFLDGGGNLLAVYTPGMAKLERFESYLAEWGIVPQQDVVLEKDDSRVIQNPLIMLPDLKDHDITKNLISQEITPIFYGTISFGIKDDNTQRATVTSIAESTSKSIGKANLESSNTSLEDGDIQGPLSLAVVSERTGDKPARIMAIGSAAALELPEQLSGTKANSQFVTSSVTWLTNNQNNLKISPKVITDGKITALTKTNTAVLYYVFVIAMPLLILIAGIAIWLRRRYL